jgi:hypothetical protein
MTLLKTIFPNKNVGSPWLLGVEINLPDSVRTDVMLLLLWHIWKARNALIFDQQIHNPSDILRKVIRVSKNGVGSCPPISFVVIFPFLAFV